MEEAYPWLDTPKDSVDQMLHPLRRTDMMHRAGKASKYALGIAMLAASTVPAFSGPFNNMAGTWSGDGTLSRKSGETERLRCRASYDVGRGGDLVNLSIRCASDSFKFDLSGYITNNGGAISGQWSEPNYNSSGSLDGQASAGNISARAIGTTFSAQISVKTQGNRQSVTISPYETDVTRVALNFSKG